MCRHRQNSVIDRERYGCSKFFIEVTPSTAPTPRAMAV
jgi:hypothetical protein